MHPLPRPIRSAWLLLCSLPLAVAAAPTPPVPATPPTPPLMAAAAGEAASALPVPAAEASPWQSTLDAFAAADQQQRPPSGGVLFVGSSSIRLWDGLETQFAAAPVVIKRGFGGARLSDCRALLARLVLPYAPRLVVVYAGDNDLAAGATPAEVAAQFAGFVAGVRAALPHARIAFVSVKPSPARRALLPQVREVNARVAAQVAATPNLDYIDIFTPMLDAHGEPRAELFGADLLHLNAAGYALWRSVIAAHVGGTAPASAPPAATSAHAATPAPTRPGR